jgi:hypothetical protein
LTREIATAVNNDSTTKRELKAELLNATLSISSPIQRHRYTSYDKGVEIRRGSRRWKKDIDTSSLGRNKGDDTNGYEYDGVDKNTVKISTNPTVVKDLTSSIVSTSGSNRSIKTDKIGAIHRSHSIGSRVVIQTNNISSHSNAPAVSCKSIEYSSNRIKIPNDVKSSTTNVERTHKPSDKKNRSDDSILNNSSSTPTSGRTATRNPDNKSKNISNNSTSSVSVKVSDKTDGISVYGSIKNSSIRNSKSINGNINDGDISNNGSSSAVRLLRFKEPNRCNKTIIELEEELREKKRLLFESELRRIKNSIITQNAVHHVNCKQAKYQLEINRLEEGMNRAREKLEEGYVVTQL